ncbi:MAG: alpha/beta hydrolase [Limnohabitans sp.]|nr:alpha/beta hydrolase [Limnohabitans sp.]
MSSHHNPHSRLTESMRLVLRNIERAGRPPMYMLNAHQARLFYEMSASILDLPEPPMARVEDLRIPMRDGQSIKGRLFAPYPKSHASPIPTLVYFHGGGFTIGSIQTHNVLCRELARIGQCAVISVDYRLAPEYRFPIATNDAWDAVQWVSKSAESMGLQANVLAVGGDSAGGTLAAVCAIHARDAGLKLALQLLIYPGTAARQETTSHNTYQSGFMLDKATVDWFFDHYIDAKDRDDWRFAPMLAERHDGLAPAWIGLAECDPLVDEGVAYADMLRMAGVKVDLEIYHGVVHGFVNMGRVIPEARQAHQDAGRALKHAFALGQ